MKLTNEQRRMVRRLAFISGDLDRSRAALAVLRREKAELLARDLHPALAKLNLRLTRFGDTGFSGGHPANYTEALADVTRERDELLVFMEDLGEDIREIDRELTAVSEDCAQAAGLVERALNFSGIGHEDFPTHGAGAAFMQRRGI